MRRKGLKISAFFGYISRNPLKYLLVNIALFSLSLLSLIGVLLMTSASTIGIILTFPIAMLVVLIYFEVMLTVSIVSISWIPYPIRLIFMPRTLFQVRELLRELLTLGEYNG